MKAWQWGLVAAGVVLCVIVAFYPAFGHPLSDIDDTTVLLEDQGWRQPFPANIVWMFSTFRVGHYQPLTYLSYAFDNAVGGDDARFFHGTNVVLHAINTLLLWWLAGQILRRAKPEWPAGSHAWAGLVVGLL